MAVIDVSEKDSIGGVVSTWTGLATGATGSPIAANGRVMCAQVDGTFSGATVTMQGSNDGTTWYALNETGTPANACAFTAAGLKGVLQVPRYVRPSVASGSGTGLTIVLFTKK